MKIAVLARRRRAQPGEPAAGPPLGPCDAAALAAALALAAGKGEVSVYAAGPADREDEALQHAHALGAGRLVRITGEPLEAIDYQGTGRVLAAAVKKHGFDLVLCGERSEDEGQGAIGPAVAEALGIAHMTGALALSTANGEGPPSVHVTRRDAQLVRTLRLPLPAVVTVTRFDGPARAAAPGAGPGKIEALDLEALGIQPRELKPRDRCVGRIHALRVSRNATLVGAGAELLERLREDRLLD